MSKTLERLGDLLRYIGELTDTVENVAGRVERAAEKGKGGRETGRRGDRETRGRGDGGTGGRERRK